jgi:hypothetical protein
MNEDRQLRHWRALAHLQTPPTTTRLSHERCEVRVTRGWFLQRESGWLPADIVRREIREGCYT